MQEVIEKSSEELDKAIDSIVKPICKDLDEYVTICQEVLQDKDNTPTGAEMDSMITNIPLMLYWVKEQRERLGVRMDLANKRKQEMYRDAYLSAEGSVNDKKEQAKTATLEAELDCIVYGRAYGKVVNKEDMALELMNSIKKVVSRRMEGIG